MSGRDRQFEEEPELTAQPKSIPDELSELSVHEQGLSIDPEDLGLAFLSDATDQGNFESLRGGESDELWASSSASSDGAMPGPNFEVDHDVWENTVNLTMQNGARATSDPLVEDNDDGMHVVEDEESGDVDLTESVIQEGSLLDHETEELGETQAPESRTDDSHMHGKMRGGHKSKTTRSNRGL